MSKHSIRVSVFQIVPSGTSLFILIAILLPVLFIGFPGQGDASAADTRECLGCHSKISGAGKPHAALEKGCKVCHTVEHDSAAHKFPKNAPLGLETGEPEICMGCHKEVNFQHSAKHPIKGNKCTSCHNPHSSENRKLLVQKDPELCYKCHSEVLFNKPTLHRPLADGCTGCHDSHGTENVKLLKAEPSALCYSCHDAGDYAGENGHKTPETACTDCHSPHSTEGESLLKVSQPDLCYKCHKRHDAENQHEPVREGACNSCHLPHASNARVNLIADAPEICFSCHADHTSKRFVHLPVKQGKCFSCHNAHQAGQPFQLKEAVQTLCFRCHDEGIVQGAYVHGPAAAGACSICHSSHESDEPHLLVASVNETCYNCHADKQEDMQAAFVHKPAAESCANCHSPHAGEYQYNLKADAKRDLCGLCHQEKIQEAMNSKHKHGALQGDRQCLECHNPHGSNFPKILYKQPMDLCFSCHDKPIEQNGKKVMDIKTKILSSKILHGPIKQGDCSSCHNTHGSDYFRMLRKYFPPKFYAPYDPKNYGLCFNCHANTLVETKATDTLTGFRNGKQNLHYVHVHKKDKGRTCRACHDAHGTNNPRHIRDGVPFGGWSLPINFTKTESGGRCAPGCHQEFGYDRERRVRNRR